MEMGISTSLYQDRPLEEVARYVSGLGYTRIELPVWRGSHHLSLDDVLNGRTRHIKEILKKYNLKISALNNARAGQLVLGPLDESTDGWAPSDIPEEKIKFGMEQMKKTARAAAELEVPVVIGFVGSDVWGKWYIYPPKNEQLYEKAWDLFATRWGEILDVFTTYGIRFASEIHPGEMNYNLETSERALEVLDSRKEFGFNLDPSHLVWQLIDPVVFIKKFPDRIYHVHAKDGEIQEEEVGRSGTIPTGSWSRLGRGFRFRVPGWGNVNWRRFISALTAVGYDYVISYEHEDPIMSREDGCEKCIAYLKPLLIKKPLEQIWW